MPKSRLWILLGGMVLFSVVATLWITYVPPRNPHPGRSERGATRTVLRYLISAQEIHWADHFTHTADLEVLAGLGVTVPEGVSLRVELFEEDGRLLGYTAVAESADIDYRCRTAVANPDTPEAMPHDSAVAVALWGIACEGSGV